MKRLFIIAGLVAMLGGLFSSCKKQLADDYLDPESTTTGTLGRLFTAMFLNERIHPTYWDYRTFILITTAVNAQTAVNYPSSSMWIPNSTYGENRWTDFYSGSPGILNQYLEMKTTYAALTETQQEEQYVYLELAKIVMFDQAAQMVDLWGDIPFSEAGSLNTDRVATNPAFDDAATVYSTIIDSLASINTYLASVSLTSAVEADVEAQDLIYGGDLTYWRRYANSLRLRLLMRISNYDEATAKSAVTTMLADETTYPLIDDNEYNAVFNMSPTDYVSNLLSAFTEGYPYAPAYLLDTVMDANGDPRTDVFWDKPIDSYKGIPTGAGAGVYDTAAGYYATYDSATFLYNYNVPGVLFTASETDFLKAEAYERWSLGTASTPYYAGIEASIDFYYDINQSRVLSSGSYATVTSPTDSAITAYEAKTAIAYSGTSTEKLEKIYTQKWEHFFILQAGQAWAELRRTGYPTLTFYTAGSSASQPPTRLLYPSTETLYNTNYSSVSASDTRDTKIFWDVN
ncbi:SusD/RagB family nutrient-binding outer membrane lipoprotein [Parafilimonas sp.]|uniref:SusD/RagB family nutrient-binding outer membrane lipoprotein n=1 Tax=Parafilimonas sp. TaxID=1969739 RepID=UPI0039E35C25